MGRVRVREYLWPRHSFPSTHSHTLPWAGVLFWLLTVREVYWRGITFSHPCHQPLPLLNAPHVYGVHESVYACVFAMTYNRQARRKKDLTPLTKLWALNPLWWHIIFTLWFLKPPLMLTKTHTQSSQVAKATHKSLGWMKGRGRWDHWYLVSLLRYRRPPLPPRSQTS